MDRFVWFVLLVVISHLVTEFTRVTGYTRGPRQDVVTVNDSLIQPIKVQNQVLYPGQEYGLYEQPSQQYYSANNPYNNYGNSANLNSLNVNVKKSNFLSSLFNQFAKSNNKENEQEQSHMSNGVNSNNLLNLPPPSYQGDGKTFSFRPLIDSIFEIPISTLRAVNDLVGRLTGGFFQPQKQQQQQQQEIQQQPTTYSFFPSFTTPNAYYGMQRAAGAVQPKTQVEVLNDKRATAELKTGQAEAKPTISSMATSGSPDVRADPTNKREIIFKETPRNLLKQ